MIPKQITQRVQNLDAQTEAQIEHQRGIRGNVIDLNANHNRAFLADALRLPLLSFDSKMRNPKNKFSVLKFKSDVSHRIYMMKVVHETGMPTAKRFEQMDHYRHLANAVEYAPTLIVPVAHDDQTLYTLTGRLYRSLGRSYSKATHYQLMILRNALARMCVEQEA